MSEIKLKSIFLQTLSERNIYLQIYYCNKIKQNIPYFYVKDKKNYMNLLFKNHEKDYSFLLKYLTNNITPYFHKHEYNYCIQWGYNNNYSLKSASYFKL